MAVTTVPVPLTEDKPEVTEDSNNNPVTLNNSKVVRSLFSRRSLFLFSFSFCRIRFLVIESQPTPLLSPLPLSLSSLLCWPVQLTNVFYHPFSSHTPLLVISRFSRFSTHLGFQFSQTVDMVEEVTAVKDV